MGFSVSKFANPINGILTGRKRKLSSDNSDDVMNKIIDDTLRQPKRKKLRTAEYIYQTLFEEGKNSDVTVLALGKAFHLHKIYLSQSPYFASMFGGSWLESTKNVIPMEIIDPCITVDSLSIVFGSLYIDEVMLEPFSIVSILATATLFQLDSIIEQCVEVMMETINTKTVISYYNAASEYGVSKIKVATFKWLEINLLNYYTDHPLKLKSFPSNLLTKLISSHDLFVIQSEFSVYGLLRTWLFNNIVIGVDNCTTETVRKFFLSRKDKEPFLLTSEGEKFVEPFRKLRLKNLILHYEDIEVIYEDNIIPPSWFHPQFFHHWYSMLRVNENVDSGPKSVEDNVFLEDCLRCGRVLQANNKQMWRWKGFHFGLDLVVISDGSALWIRRNHKADCDLLLSFQSQKNFLIRVTLASVDEKLLRIRYIQSTGVRSITCSKNEEVPLLMYEKKLLFPVYVSINLLFTSPVTFMENSSSVLTETIEV